MGVRVPSGAPNLIDMFLKMSYTTNMNLKSNILSHNEWTAYQHELLRGFKKADISYKKYREVRNICYKIDWRFSEISQLKVKIRQDHKEAFHREYIDRFYSEIHELIEVLNENFVLEILLGD